MEMMGKELFTLMKDSGKKWAIFVAETDGVKRAYICFPTEDDIMAIGMDLEMLEGIVPSLQTALVKIRNGDFLKDFKIKENL